MVKRARIHARVLTEARSAFRGMAYSDVTIRDIAAAADVDPVVLMRLFKSKRAFYEAVLRSVPPAGRVFGATASSARGAFVSAALSPSGDDPVRLSADLQVSAIGSESTASCCSDRHIAERDAAAAALGGADAEMRAALLTDLLIGLAALDRLVGPEEPGDALRARLEQVVGGSGVRLAACGERSVRAVGRSPSADP